MSGGSSVYGLHAVRAVLTRRPGDVSRLSLAQGRDDQRMRELREFASARGVRAATVPTAALDQETGGAAHQGVVAEVRPSVALNENGLLDLLTAADPPALVLVLDGVSDPHNLGACLRTADAAGALAVVAPHDRAAGLTPVVRKVAAGAAETVPFAQVTNLAARAQGPQGRGPLDRRHGRGRRAGQRLRLGVFPQERQGCVARHRIPVSSSGASTPWPG